MRLLIPLLLSALLIGCASDPRQETDLDTEGAAAQSSLQGGTSPTILPPFGSNTLQLAQVTSTPVHVPQLYRIGEPGCCSHPAWSPDSTQVLFLDRPSAEEEAGIYSLPSGGGMQTLVSTRVGIYSRDWSRVAYPEGGETYVERLSDHSKSLVPSKGRAVIFSGDSSRVAWQAGTLAITNPDRRRNEIWVAQWDGSAARRVVSVIGGGLIGWSQGDQALVVTGRMSESGPSGIWRISLAEEQGARLLWETPSPRGALLSPEGGWLAFYQAFSETSRQDGLYVLRTDGSQGLRLDEFGSYRWRSEGTLLLIPMDLEQPDIQLRQIDVGSAKQREIEIPSPADFLIANNDWMPSPDGSMVVFVSSEDDALWILELPGD